jgi:hypothetical protein
VRWTLEQLKTRLVALVIDAGHGDLAKNIDQPVIADRLSQAEKDILAKL